MSRQDTKPTPHPGYIPTTPIIWPAPAHRSDQIQQTKGSAKPQVTNVLPTTQPNVPSVPPRTTPQPVSRLRVVSKTSNGQKTLTVKFTHPAGDSYFQGANIYLRRAGQQPTLVAGGAKSPLTFSAPVNAAPHSIFVTSFGPWGETNVDTAPSSRVRLSN